MDIAELQHVFAQVWIRETSAFPNEWTPENPAYGQCLPTAWIAKQYLGGSVVQAVVRQPTIVHFWNVLPSGEKHDFTDAQFQGQCIPWKCAHIEELVPDLFHAYCNVFPGVGERFRLFRKRFEVLTHQPTF